MNKSYEKPERNSPLQMVNDLVEVAMICDADSQTFIEHCLSIKTNRSALMTPMTLAILLKRNAFQGCKGTEFAGAARHDRKLVERVFIFIAGFRDDAV